ncbi:MAG: ATP-binding protein [Bacteroidales bacterium]|nr:ATP-binding protein [Bacteroidales bacterium]
MIKDVAKSQVLDRIRFENPWWLTNEIDPFYSEMPERAYFNRFKNLANDVSVTRAVVLMGPRRIGKTVMLYHWVRNLLNQGIDARKIIFVTIENPIYNNIGLDKIFEYAREAIGNVQDVSDWYVIFDEIQYLKNWDVHLKSLVDSYRNNKFVVSGSAAAALQYKSIESGAGRFSDFMLPPITFYEFINMQNLGYLVKPVELPWGDNTVSFFESSDIKRFNKLFVEYINIGGYPEAIFSEAIRKNPDRFIRQDVVDKVLLRDLPSLYGIADVQDLNTLFTSIAYNSGQEFSLETLSKQSGSPKNTIKKYLAYLEAAFLIRIVKRIDQSGKRFKRDNFFKIYLTNPALRSALFSPIDSTDEFMGAMAETAVFSQWMHRQNFTPYYARWSRGEVDMVGLSNNLIPTWALEIKWSDKYINEPTKLKSLLSFCTDNGLSQALVTTINFHDVKTISKINLTFIPCSTYAYTVGLNTINRE